MVILSIKLISCTNQEIKIIIENKSNESISELVVYVQGTQFKVDKIEVNKNKIISISKNSIALNTHDFRIESTLKLRDGKINSGFYFSDLSGNPNSKYIIEVHDSHTIIK